MRQLKPGQIYHPPNTDFNVRVKRRKCGCEGCILDSPYICPDIEPKGGVSYERPCCEANNIIFVKP